MIKEMRLHRRVRCRTSNSLRCGGLLQQLTKRVLESALEGEITDHVGYDKHDPAGKNNGNSRNGTRAKTVLTDVGPVDRQGPQAVDHALEGAPERLPDRLRRPPHPEQQLTFNNQDQPLH